MAAHRKFFLMLLSLTACALAAAESEAAKTQSPANWEAAYNAKLNQHVSFEFTDTPLPEVTEFLAQLLKINVLVDPNAVADVENVPAMKFKANNIPLSDALRGLLQQAGLDYAMRDEAMIVFKKGAYAKNMNPQVAPLTDAETKTFQKAASDLSSDDFQTRENATETILTLGPAAGPLLKNVQEKTADAETLSRVQKLLAGFKSMLIYPEPPEVARALDALTKKINFEFDDTPVTQALEYLNTIGNVKAANPPRPNESSHVTMKASSMSAGNALRWLARLSGERIILRDGQLGLAKGER